MATGSYGTIRPADVSPEDVEILLHYTPTRDETNNFVLTTLDNSVLTPYFNNNATGGQTVELLGGLYNLKLPMENFNNLGIYIFICWPLLSSIGLTIALTPNKFLAFSICFLK